MKKPSSWRGKAGVLLLVAAFLIPLGILVLRQSPLPEDAPVSDFPGSSAGPSYAAPDFERVTLEGTSLRLSAQRGRVIVLNFWATWCAPCRFEIPAFIELQREMGPVGLRFIGVSLDEEGFEVVRPFAEEMGINYALVMGDEALADAYGGIMGLPTTFVIDRQGRIRQRFVGMVREETLRIVLGELLREEAPAEGQR